MKILLIKPETIGVFGWTSQVEHEPLELEYLYTVLKEQGHDAVIYDRRHDLTSLKKKLRTVVPRVVCITGYITQEPLMIKLTHRIKQFDKSIKVIIGGSHAEINYQNFYRSEADFIYHLSGLRNFTALISYIGGSKDIALEDIKGICYPQNGEWICHKKEAESPADLPIPDRSYFYSNQERYRFMTFNRLALVMNSYSCQNACTFCFCTNRNSGKYQCRSAENLVDEIEALQASNIHITDDNFLANSSYLESFIALLRARNIHKNFLVYGTADFIANHEELMGELKKVGLALVMVGLEATSDKELDAYHKRASLQNNEECLRILHKYDIICSGLFIVQQDMTKQDFNKLYHWIADRPVMPTISVFTPMQGAAVYKEYEDQLLTKSVLKQDLAHCILKPLHMSVFQFQMQFYRLTIRLAFHNRRQPWMSSVGFGDFLYVLKVTMIKLRRLFVV